eukprot:scaffold1305_cov374-Prasinococcus_capsulatus_cf.AAC.13
MASGATDGRTTSCLATFARGRNTPQRPAKATSGPVCCTWSSSSVPLPVDTSTCGSALDR